MDNNKNLLIETINLLEKNNRTWECYRGIYCREV